MGLCSLDARATDPIAEKCVLKKGLDFQFGKPSTNHGFIILIISTGLNRIKTILVNAVFII